MKPTYKSIRDMTPHGFSKSAPPSTKKSPFKKPLVSPSVIASNPNQAIHFPMRMCFPPELNVLLGSIPKN